MNTRAERSLVNLGCVCLLLSTTTLSAQSLPDSPIIFHSGQWDVHRTRDAMTDATACIGVSGGQFGIQLGADALTIAVPDHVKSVQLRFDDETPKPVREATSSEIRNSRIEIDGHDFAELLDSRRLRYEAITFDNTSVTGTVDLAGVFQAHDNITAGCAGNPISTSTATPAADACTPAMRERMAGKGLSDVDIDDICRK